MARRPRRSPPAPIRSKTNVRRRADRIQRGTTSGTGPRAAARRAAQKRRALPTSPTKPNKRPRG